MVIGELLIDRVVVVLNKIDILPVKERGKLIEQKIVMIKKAFKKTKFGQQVDVIPMSACTGANSEENNNTGVQSLINCLMSKLTIPKRLQT